MSTIENDQSLKEAIKEEIEVVNVAYEGVVTYELVNSVLIDILHENNNHDPKELFKK